jgi:hypothetical protein
MLTNQWVQFSVTTPLQVRALFDQLTTLTEDIDVVFRAARSGGCSTGG